MHAIIPSASMNKKNIDILLNESILSIDTGDYNGASILLEHVLTRDSNNVDAWCLLGVLAEREGNLDLATTFIKRAILLHPEFWMAYIRLAEAYARLGRVDEAKEIFQFLATKEEARKIPEFYLGIWMIERGQRHVTNANKYLRKYLKLVSEYALAGSHKKVPREKLLGYEIFVNCDVECILDSPEKEKKTLKNLMKYFNKLIESREIVSGIPLAITNILFYLVYYDTLSRPYLEKAAEFYRKLFPDLFSIAPHCKAANSLKKNKKIRLGIVSAYLDSAHAVAFCFSFLIESFSRDIFDIVYFKIVDGSANNLSKFDVEKNLGKVTFITLPRDSKKAREIISSHEMDILWYTDIGLVSQSYWLAHSRLAPIQCVSGGHPVTTGLSTIDYFISSRLHETPKAQENYTEKLILLPCYPILYPEFHLHENTLKRSDLGLPKEGRLYFCAQTTFKINPAMDGVFKAILEKDKEALIVFSYGETIYSKQLLTRLEKSLGEFSSRCYFINTLGRNEFLMLLDIVDVILDTFPFGGGNTTLQSIIVNQPMVHLAGTQLRSTATGGTLEMIGLQEVIAKTKEEYVEIALKLAQDKPYRESIRQKIKENKHLIFNQDETIKNAYVKLFQDLYHQRNLEEYF